MATLIRRRNRDGSVRWLAQVRVQGYPSRGQTFRTMLEAQQCARHHRSKCGTAGGG